MTTLADLGRDELEELARLHRVSEAGILAARANVARAKADRAREVWRRQAERTADLARTAGQIGKRDGFRGEAFRTAWLDADAQRRASADAERLWRRDELAAQAAERALRRAGR